MQTVFLLAACVALASAGYSSSEEGGHGDGCGCGCGGSNSGEVAIPIECGEVVRRKLNVEGEASGYYGGHDGYDGGYQNGYGNSQCGCGSCRQSLTQLVYPRNVVKQCSKGYKLPSKVHVTPTVIRRKVFRKCNTRRVYHVKPVHFVTRTQIVHRKPCGCTKLKIKRRVVVHHHAEKPCGCARPRVIYVNKPCNTCGGSGSHSNSNSASGEYGY